MAKITNIPNGIKVPEIDFRSVKDYTERCNKFYEELRGVLKNLYQNDEYTGKIIRFPVADGSAEYMIVTIKPLWLVHIPLWDAYEFEYVNRLTSSDVIKKVKQQEAIEKMFKRE